MVWLADFCSKLRIAQPPNPPPTDPLRREARGSGPSIRHQLLQFLEPVHDDQESLSPQVRRRLAFMNRRSLPPLLALEALRTMSGRWSKSWGSWRLSRSELRSSPTGIILVGSRLDSQKPRTPLGRSGLRALAHANRCLTHDPGTTIVPGMSLHQPRQKLTR